MHLSRVHTPDSQSFYKPQTVKSNSEILTDRFALKSPRESGPPDGASSIEGGRVGETCTFI